MITLSFEAIAMIAGLILFVVERVIDSMKDKAKNMYELGVEDGKALGISEGAEMAAEASFEPLIEVLAKKDYVIYDKETRRLRALTDVKDFIESQDAGNSNAPKAS